MPENNSYWCNALPNMPRAFSPSSLTTAATCARKWMFNYIEGYELTSSPQILFGTYFHEAIEKFDYHKAKGDSWLKATTEAVRTALITSKDWVSEKNSHTRFTLVRAVVWYCDKYNHDPAETQIMSSGAMASEVAFQVALPRLNPDGDPYILTGYMDGIAEVAGLMYIRERKTTGSTLNKNFYARYSMDHQPDAYIFAASVLYQKPFHGVLYDVAQTAVNFTELGRHEEVRDQSQIEEWLEEVLYLIKTVEQWVEADYFPANRASCNNYGGCPYRQYCALPPSMRKSFMDSNIPSKRRETIGRKQEDLES